jgi:nucleotide-binding universal stress UspA family protein
MRPDAPVAPPLTFSARDRKPCAKTLDRHAECWPNESVSTRILLATDFSDASEEAASQAHAIAARDHAALGLVHVLPEPMPTAAQIPAWLVTHIPNSAEIAARARAALESRAVKLMTGGVNRVDTYLEESADAAAALSKRAETFGADLLVVGSHGRTGITRVLLGSVAEKIVRLAPCAVLVARKSPETGPIVTSTDFSAASKPGLRAAAVEAARTGSPLVAIHVFDLAWPGPTPYAVDASALSAVVSDTEALRTAREQLQQLLEEATRGLLVQATAEVLVGEPAALVVQRAEQLGARRVVVSTHGRTGLSRLLLGSVAERIVRLAHTSVVAVRAAPTAGA